MPTMRDRVRTGRPGVLPEPRLRLPARVPGRGSRHRRAAADGAPAGRGGRTCACCHAAPKTSPRRARAATTTWPARPMPRRWKSPRSGRRFPVHPPGQPGPESSAKLFREDIRRIHPESARIVLLEGGDRLLPVFPPRLSKYTQRELVRRGVDVRTGALVADASEMHVTTRDGTTIETTTIVWTAGVRPTDLVTRVEAPHTKADRARRSCSTTPSPTTVTRRLASPPPTCSKRPAFGRSWCRTSAAGGRTTTSGCWNAPGRRSRACSMCWHPSSSVASRSWCSSRDRA